MLPPHRCACVLAAATLLLANGCGSQADAPSIPAGPAPQNEPASGSPNSLSENYTPAVAARTAAAMGQMISAAVDLVDVEFHPATGGLALNLKTFVEATGTYEYYSLFVPPNAGQTARPLLVAFHIAWSSHHDITVRTDLFEEAAARGWHLLAPIQINTAGGPPDTSFGSAQSQLHVEAVLARLLDELPIDENRIYGVGFSMGGGACLSYAARHRDLRHPGVFAAVVNHTGTVALSHVYDNEDPNTSAGAHTRSILELIFSGTPADAPFPWGRSSLITLDSAGVLVQDGPHFATNLTRTPAQTWFNTLDGLTQLQRQSLELDAYLTSAGGTQHALVQVTNGDTLCVDGHCWSTLDQQMACDWLSQQSLQPFTPDGSILIDRDGGWEVFDVLQQAPEEFSSLSYSISELDALIEYSGVTNIRQIDVDVNDVGITPFLGSTLKVQTSRDAGDLTVVVLGIPHRPELVTLHGSAIPLDCGPSPQIGTWCYIAAEERLELRCDASLMNSWRIEF